MSQSSLKPGGTGPVLVVSATQLTDVNLVRVERQADRGPASPRDIQYVASEGPYRGVIVNRRSQGEFTKVSKPHCVAHFFAYSYDRKNIDELPVREKRELRFWFYKNVAFEDRASLATEYFKILIEPETFPRGYGCFIKKVISLMQRYRQMRRIEVCSQPSPEPEPPKEEWEMYEQQPIENFITVLTPALYDYQYLPEVPVSKKTSVAFRVRAAADAHIALSNVYGDTERRTYEILLGGLKNTKSMIRYGGRGPVEAETLTPSILDPEEFKPFWITWDKNCLRIGNGMQPGDRTIMQWHIPPRKLHTINLMSVSTGPGSDGQWEFVEYLERATPWSDSRPARRRKIRRGVLWHAKKTKMLESLEDSFPNSLDTKELLRLSTVSLAEMLEAVVFLKDLQKKGSVLEVCRGVWLRGPIYKGDEAHELKVVNEFPSKSELRDSAPTIAIVTSLFCEKVAVDSMMDNKVSYVRHSTEGGTKVYTLGKMGDQRVVSVKLPKLRERDDTIAKYKEILNHLKDTFDQLQHVMVVGVGGAVPDYTDYLRHVRRGDVTVSMPKAEGGIQYIYCQEVDQSDSKQASYATSTWSASDDNLQKVVRQLADYASRGYDRPVWDKYIIKSQEQLCPTDSIFHRPPAKTDKLFAILEGEDKPVLVRHPQPPPDKQHLYKENMPNVRLGPIASGKLVAMNDVLRMDFAACNGDVKAYDRGMHNLVEALSESSLSSYIIVLGIADYADGSKTRTWQPYAALCAAAYVKNLIISLGTFGGSRRRSSYYH